MYIQHDMPLIKWWHHDVDARIEHHLEGLNLVKIAQAFVHPNHELHTGSKQW